MADKTVGAAEAQRQLPDLLAFVREGNEVVISDGEKPVARIVPVGAVPTALSPDRPRQRRRRIAGLTPGVAHMSPDFDEPLPDSFWLGEE